MTHPMARDIIGPKSGEGLTDTQLLAYVAHFEHLAQWLPFEEERTAAADTHTTLKADLDTREIPVSDHAIVYAMAAALEKNGVRGKASKKKSDY